MVFSADPWDRTSRGDLITPLRDRIGSQVITPYPLAREDGMTETLLGDIGED